MSRKYIGKIDKDKGLHLVSVNWMKWKAKYDAPDVISKNWLNWETKRQEIERGEHAEFKFNIQSDHHVRWLLYDCLGFEAVEFTNDGLPSVSSKVLPVYGEIGELLIDYAGLEKEQGYLTDYMDRLVTGNRDTLHFGFQMPGTLTGRLSGKDPNFQQLPKTKRCMSLFRARPGYKFVDVDFSALEPHVGAELSQDADLLALYGPGAPAVQDIYLFYGSHPSMPDSIRLPIISTGYDRNAPTKETLAKAKKECKTIRQLLKGLILSDTYGSGVAKKQQILRNQGIQVSLEEVQSIHDALQSAKSGVTEYSNKLKREWRENQGYIMSGLGRPLGMHQRKLKDVWNTQCQATGHDILVIYCYMLAQAIDAEGIEWYPAVFDIHDATTLEVREEQAGRVAKIMLEVMAQLNKDLDGTVPLKGVPTIGDTLADVKEPES